MKYNRFFKSGPLMAALVLGALIIAVVVMQETMLDSFAAPIAVTRQPRPQPQSHFQIAEPDSVTRLPRPHPKSHIRSIVTETPFTQP